MAPVGAGVMVPVGAGVPTGFLIALPLYNKKVVIRGFILCIA